MIAAIFCLICSHGKLANAVRSKNSKEQA